MSFVASPPPVPATSIADLDAAIEALDAKKAAWVAVPLAERVALLERCIAATLGVAEEWAATGARIKGLDPQDRMAGEEWIAGVMPTVRNARLLADALRQGGAPRPVATRTGPEGRTIARVFPQTLKDRALFTGVLADVWIQNGKPASQGAQLRQSGRVGLVLGGGNVSSIPAMDAFYKLFVENEVVLLKMNPVNEALGPILARALEPLVSGGWLAIVYGGAEVGAHAAKHPKVGSLHVTGSDRTYDAVHAQAPDKPFSAELGCVTPVIVVPGPWSHTDVRFQARHVASMVTNNASFNCNAAKVVIVAREWLQRAAFLDALRDELRKAPARKAYYPGAQERYRAFLDRHPKADVLGEKAEGSVPWTLIDDPDDYALRNEAFCGLVSLVEVSAPEGGLSVPRFLEQATEIANERCWGTLSCCVLVHPATEHAHPAEIGRTIERLRYGAIGINLWPGVVYGLVSPTWGAYPGHTAKDIQSGTGVVHNTWLFDHPEKSVVRGPFRIRPTPVWFGDHRNLLDVGRKLVAYEANPTWKSLVRVALAALRG